MKRSAKTIYLQDYTPPHYLIDTVQLDISLQPTKTKVKSKLRIRPNPIVQGKREPLFLNGENLTLERVKVSGKTLPKKDYRVSKAGITFLREFQRPFTLEITTHCNPDENKALSGLYRTRNVYCTQCEAQGFRRITYYLDRPDVMAIFTIRIEAKASDTPVLLSNGNLVDSGAAGKAGYHYAVWHDPHPKPCYLFALVGGKLSFVKDTFQTRSKKDIDLRIYVEPGKEDRCDWAMQSLKRSMRWDEKRFGLEYDLDIFMIVAVSDFNMGAMENKGLNIFNDKLILASPDTATDTDYAAIESVIAHEYFHNWTGNRVTCRDWFQLCLKEGLTVFRDQEFTADVRSRIVKRIQDVRLLRTHQFPEDAGPLAHPVRPEAYIEINNFYTATVYEKGAELCRMISIMLGQKGFRGGMDLYFERYDNQAATVENFIQSMEEANDVDLSQFMLWYKQAGTPQVLCKFSYNKRRKEVEIDFHQVCPKTPGQVSKKAQHIPIKLGLIDSAGHDLDLPDTTDDMFANGIFHLKSHKQKVVFENITERPVPSLLRDFSAPVEFNLELSDSDLEFIMGHDSDLFNRWQAAQDYAVQILLQHIKTSSQHKKIKKGSHFAKILAQTLKDDHLEEAYRAEFLRLPSETDLARQLGNNINPDAVHAARKCLLDTITTDLKALLIEIYETNSMRGRYTQTAKSVGKRALRNMALTLLGGLQNSETQALAKTHYDISKNMTDKIAALSVLSDSETDIHNDVFDDFYQTWKDDHLVVDKWFMLQAISSRTDAFERVKELKKHPKFSIKNPNKVRALLGAFTQANTKHFNRPDGQAYDFIAQIILEIDRFNPQVAARLSNSFRSWKTLEPNRRKLAKEQLETIVKDKKLSRDTYEIVSRTLGHS
ncbi:MAG: aminopeptidase N [Pseudomonadota bacterium]